MGNSYELGEGVLQDFVLAHMWYNISAANGYKISFENRNNVSKRMSKDQIEKAQDFARKCLESNYINCGYWNYLSKLIKKSFSRLFLSKENG